LDRPLIENALRTTPTGGTVTVTANKPGTLVVEDTGPGLDSDELARAFERSTCTSATAAAAPSAPASDSRSSTN